MTLTENGLEHGRVVGNDVSSNITFATSSSFKVFLVDVSTSLEIGEFTIPRLPRCFLIRGVPYLCWGYIAWTEEGPLNVEMTIVLHRHHAGQIAAAHEGIDCLSIPTRTEAEEALGSLFL